MLVRNKTDIEHVTIPNNNRSSMHQIGNNNKTSDESSFSMESSGNKVNDAVVIKNPGSPDH